MRNNGDGSHRYLTRMTIPLTLWVRRILSLRFKTYPRAFPQGSLDSANISQIQRSCTFRTSRINRNEGWYEGGRPYNMLGGFSYTLLLRDNSSIFEVEYFKVSRSAHRVPVPKNFPKLQAWNSGPEGRCVGRQTLVHIEWPSIHLPPSKEQSTLIWVNKKLSRDLRIGIRSFVKYSEPMCNGWVQPIIL